MVHVIPKCSFPHFFRKPQKLKTQTYDICVLHEPLLSFNKTKEKVNSRRFTEKL